MRNFFLIASKNIAYILTISLFLTGTTHAAPVSTTVQGIVTFASASNPFGLSDNDNVTAVAKYDDSVIPNTGNFFLELDSAKNPLLTLTITLGSYIYRQTDDADFGFGGPELAFSNGILNSIDFFHDQFAFGNFRDLQSGLDIDTNGFFVDDFQNNVTLLKGTWDFTNAQTTPIPAPGTLLLAISLIGLIRFFRSK